MADTKNINLIVCETVAAITTHLRDTTVLPASYSGFTHRPKTLCNMDAAWDTRLPLETARCLVCLKKAIENRLAPGVVFEHGIKATGKN